jgi:hypothetical protein
MATTWDPAHATNVTLSNGNLTVTGTANSDVGTWSTTSKSAGKQYFEVKYSTTTAGQSGFGLINGSGSFPGIGNGPATNGVIIFESGVSSIWINGTNVNSSVSNLSNMTTQVAADIPNALIWFRPGGSGNWNGIGGASPGGSGGVNMSGITPGGGVKIAVVCNVVTDVATLAVNTSQFLYTVPSGFSAWDGVAIPTIPSLGTLVIG